MEYETNHRQYVYLSNFFVPWCRTPLITERKINFSFYRRKGAPNRTRFKEARLVAYASLQKFSKYTYYLGSEPKLTQKPLSSNLYNEM